MPTMHVQETEPTSGECATAPRHVFADLDSLLADDGSLTLASLRNITRWCDLSGGLVHWNRPLTIFSHTMLQRQYLAIPGFNRAWSDWTGNFSCPEFPIELRLLEHAQSAGTMEFKFGTRRDNYCRAFSIYSKGYFDWMLKRDGLLTYDAIWRHLVSMLLPVTTDNWQPRDDDFVLADHLRFGEIQLKPGLTQGREIVAIDREGKVRQFILSVPDAT